MTSIQSVVRYPFFQTLTAQPCSHFDYHTGSLPDTFQIFLLPIGQKHSYNTQLASKSSYSLPNIRTNYGKFNIRFAGPKRWNDIIMKILKILESLNLNKNLKNYYCSLTLICNFFFLTCQQFLAVNILCINHC